MLEPRRLRFAVIVFLLPGALSMSAARGANFQQYSGSLSVATNTVDVGGSYWMHQAIFSWAIDDNSPGFGTWHYSYTLSVLNSAGSGIQFLDLQTGANFTSADLSNVSWGGGHTVGVIDSNLNSPNMPTNLTGIQFTNDGNFYTTWKISFDSNRSPIWGEFYARGLSANWTFDKGFEPPIVEPNVLYYPLQNGTVWDHILIPGGAGGEPNNIGRTGSINVFKFNDYDGLGTARTDPNFRLGGFLMRLDGNSGDFAQLTGPDGSTLFSPLNVQFPWTLTEANMPAGWSYVEALVYDSNGLFVGRTTDPNILVDISGQDMSVYIGNVPEPATMALLAAGGAVWAARLRRRLGGRRRYYSLPAKPR